MPGSQPNEDGPVQKWVKDNMHLGPLELTATGMEVVKALNAKMQDDMIALVASSLAVAGVEPPSVTCVRIDRFDQMTQDGWKLDLVRGSYFREERAVLTGESGDGREIRMEGTVRLEGSCL